MMITLNMKSMIYQQLVLRKQGNQVYHSIELNSLP